MRLGLCCEAVDYALERVRAGIPGLELIRFDCPWDLPDDVLDARVARVRAFGFTPLPILAIPYPSPTLSDEQVGRFAGWAGRFVDRNHLDVVEVLNEPRILGRWSPAWYRWMAEATCRVLRADCPWATIVLAGEMLQPDRRGPKRVDWWAKATRDLNPSLYDGVALHPYREPGPPHVTRFASRADEYAWCRQQARNKPLWVTETGWNLSRRVSEAQQAAYLVQEIAIAAAADVAGLCLYAAIGRTGEPMDFGLWHDDGTAWVPRPAVGAVREWLEENRP